LLLFQGGHGESLPRGRFSHPSPDQETTFSSWSLAVLLPLAAEIKNGHLLAYSLSRPQWKKNSANTVAVTLLLFGCNQPMVLFFGTKSAPITNTNQPILFFSHNKSVPTTGQIQPNSTRQAGDLRMPPDKLQEMPVTRRPNSVPTTVERATSL